MLNAGTAVGNLGEVVLAHLFLFLETERAMIRRDPLKMVLLESSPKLFLVPPLAQRRSKDILGRFEPGLVHVLEREIEILGTSLRVHRQSAIAGLADFFKCVIAAEVHDVD